MNLAETDFALPYMYTLLILGEDAKIAEERTLLEKLGARKNISVITQSCAAEVAEFCNLNRMSLGGDIVAFKEPGWYWQSYVLKPITPRTVLSSIAELQYKRLVAILEQNLAEAQRLNQQFNAYKAFLARGI